MDILSFLLTNLLSIGLIAIFTFLLEPIRLRYGYFIHVTRNARCLFEQMEHLEGRMKDLLRGGNAAKVWVSKVTYLKEEVDDFKGEHEKWQHHGFFFRLLLTYGIAMKAGDLLERAELLAKVNVDAGRQPLLPPVQERDASDCVLGLESLRKQALTYLGVASPPTHLDVVVPGPRVIGILGEPGVGKTTLLKEINNYFAESHANNLFAHVVWATVSKDVNLKKLQEDVAQDLGLSLDQNQSLQQRIFNYMKDKSFLLLLDNLWAPLNLEELGIPNPQEDVKDAKKPQRRVVFTTKSQFVCDTMQAMDAKKERIEVPPLSEANAWRLFRRILGDKFSDSDSEIHNLAMDVVKECRGVPLALKVIGAAFSSRKSRKDWEDTLKSLKESQSIPGMVTTVKMEPCGGTGGSSWRLEGISRLTKIRIWQAVVIDAVSFEYHDSEGSLQQSPRYGGPGGDESLITLAGDEIITSIAGTVYKDYVVESLLITTNHRSYGPFGRQSGMDFSLATEGRTVIGFHGRSGLYLDAIGFLFDVPGWVHWNLEHQLQ